MVRFLIVKIKIENANKIEDNIIINGKEVQEEQPKEEQKPKNTAGINETAEADGLQLVVTSAQTNGGAEFVTPEDGKIFLIVHVKATNAGDNKVDVNKNSSLSIQLIF